VADLQTLVQSFVDAGLMPGAVGIVVHGSGAEVAAAGSLDAAGGVPMTRDAWLYNTCSDVLGLLIGRVSGRALPEFLAQRLDDPIARWLPELAAPVVVRTPAAPIDDVVPVVRPIAVEDLLAFRAGGGWTRGTCRAGTDGSAAQGPRRT
jgi:hypothetical protein